MGKRIVLAGICVFVAWGALDFVIHVLILGGAYEATALLWRPEAEMKMGVMYLAVFLAAMAFSAIYGWLISPRTTGAALKYGLLFGLAMGISMGYGTYSVMPIPYWMAFTWFMGTVVEALVGGLIVGLIIREQKAIPAG